MLKHLPTTFSTLLVFLFLTQFCFAQTILYQTDLSSQPNGITATGWKSSTTTPSDYSGASGLEYYINEIPSGNQPVTYTIDLANNISTVGHLNVTVSWGGFSSSTNDVMELYYSTIRNGIEKYVLVTNISSNNTSGWSLRTATLPVDANNQNDLKLRWSFRSTKTGQQGFSSYSIDDIKITAEKNTPLPVNIISFTGKTETGKNILNWKTASEKNNDRFEIQKSQDGKNFNSIGEVKPESGNSNTIRSYSFTDQNTFGEISYYRLKQVDFDGTKTFSSIIIIRNNKPIQVSVYPNLVSDFMKIQLPHEFTTEQNFEIINIKGTTIKNFTTSISNIINVEDLAPGIYFVKAAGLDNCYKVKFVKL